MCKDRAVCQAKPITQNISYHRQWSKVQTQADKWGRNVTWWHEAVRQAALGGRAGARREGLCCTASTHDTNQTECQDSQIGDMLATCSCLDACQPAFGQVDALFVPGHGLRRKGLLNAPGRRGG
jgi:hypothetical protein